MKKLILKKKPKLTLKKKKIKNYKTKNIA